MEFTEYGLRFINLAKSINGVVSLRYDKAYGAACRADDWDDEMGDAPSHPVHHLHVNFAVPSENPFQQDNDLRLPTGFVDPIVILRSIDCWYRRKLGI